MHMKKQQRGGTVVGFILGVIVGLGGALAVAVYVTKVPVPFLNKNGTRAPDQDAAEAKRNKNWDPNAPLYGKNPARPVTPAPEAAPATALAASALVSMSRRTVRRLTPRRSASSGPLHRFAVWRSESSSSARPAVRATAPPRLDPSRPRRPGGLALIQRGHTCPLLLSAGR